MLHERHLPRCKVPEVSWEDGAKLPYGLTADGRLARVSEVSSGLGCNCVCPDCRMPLQARKGDIRKHYFAHHADRACTGAWETTLHLLAKEVIAASRSIMLPEAAAVLGDASEHVARSMAFTYEAVELEVVMGAIRPDAMVRGGGRELAVEVAVTHTAEEAKLDELRRRGLAAIEIDLSRVPRHASREEHAELILRTAPRKWLYNAKIEEAMGRLRDASAATEAAEHRRRLAMFGRIAKEVADVWDVPPAEGEWKWRREAVDAGFGRIVGLDLPGWQCFAVDAVAWQAAFLKHAVIGIAGHEFSADEPLRYLQRSDLLKEPFSLRRDWGPDLVAHLRGAVPGFVSPVEVVEAYARELVRLGVLEALPDGRWRGDRARAREAEERVRHAGEARKRRATLRGITVKLLASVPGGERFDVEAWLKRPLAPGAASPAAVAEVGGRAFDDLVMHVSLLGAMMSVPGNPASNNLLGLPLEEARAVRAAEERRRTEEMEAMWRELDRRAEEKRRQESAECLDALVRDAGALLGTEAGLAWAEEMMIKVAGISVVEGRYALDGNMRRALGDALEERRAVINRARTQERARLEREAAAAALAARCQGRLEARVMAKFASEDRAKVWMDSKQPRLGGKPRDYCVDERTMEACLRLLESVPRAKFKG